MKNNITIYCFNFFLLYVNHIFHWECFFFIRNTSNWYLDCVSLACMLKFYEARPSFQGGKAPQWCGVGLLYNPFRSLVEIIFVCLLQLTVQKPQFVQWFVWHPQPWQLFLYLLYSPPPLTPSLSGPLPFRHTEGCTKVVSPCILFRLAAGHTVNRLLTITNHVM